MKLKIEIDFTDKYSNKKYKAGDEIDFSSERAKELLADERGLVTPVDEEKPKPKHTKVKVKKNE